MTKAIIKLEDGRAINVVLDPINAPISTANFIKLAKSGFYKGTIFHRVIPDFMIQGGGMDIDMNQKKADTIKGEFKQNGVNNALRHLKGTLSMARTMVPDSASSQFFICSMDTPHLDGAYAAFGKVEGVDGIALIEEISLVKTKQSGYHSDVPVTPIIIESVTIIE